MTHLLRGQSPLPVLPLDVILRAQLLKDGLRVETVHVRVSDVPNRIDDGSALILRQQWRMFAADVPIGRDIAQQRHVHRCRCGAKVFDMSTVQRIKSTVDHGNLSSILPKLIEFENHGGEDAAGRRETRKPERLIPAAGGNACIG